MVANQMSSQVGADYISQAKHIVTIVAIWFIEDDLKRSKCQSQNPQSKLTLHLHSNLYVCIMSMSFFSLLHLLTSSIGLLSHAAHCVAEVLVKGVHEGPWIKLPCKTCRTISWACRKSQVTKNHDRHFFFPCIIGLWQKKRKHCKWIV